MSRLAYESPIPALTRTEHPEVVLGFDYGERRIGVAVGQMVTGTATPLATLRGTAEGLNWPAIDALVQVWKPEALVVGRPSAEHQGAQAIKAAIAAFRRHLKARFGLPVYTVDEAYSSTEAYQRLKSQRRMENSNKRIDKREIDRMAAAILLQAWLASVSSPPPKNRAAT